MVWMLAISFLSMFWLAVTPLIGGVQVHRCPAPWLPGRQGQQQLAPSCEFLCSYKSYSPGEVVPRSWDSQQWWAVQAPGKMGTCTCSQHPQQWWRQQWQWSVPASGVQDSSRGSYGGSPLPVCTPAMVPYLSDRSRLLPSLPQLLHTTF